ncbi:DsbA family protein [Sporosarcina pasteurii]|uniref:DSBA-like thioredoxin domain n=1 Tax=Sporosarcina pasteurii TaxID=1474 RepID=A0A380BB83_SPOPA|nr:DsbA family protein [Sporosarcina pasteurii]MDS9472907.1 DsbA family protein [Sporosarcina pasteurii]QBQ06454.1 DsbA family protein [Sporosarcina pasteurii]SUI98436.1 DSBA-like thioredoxin domain [Sporosarcina pasteurii]
MDQKNNMMCDMETGICGPTGEDSGAMEFIDLSAQKKTIELYYVTDPICSHCWALEPVLRRFVDQYNHYFNMHTVMGGLLEKWEGFADVSNGISSPADVAGHWREVGEHSRMPIDGTVWYDNPIESSFIPSRVYKVIQEKNPALANPFLRRAREELFAFNQNIAQDETLIKLVNQIGLNGEEIVQESKLPEANTSLQEDFQLVRQLGVRGFPTIVMVNEEQHGVRIVGARTLEDYTNALQKLLPNETLRAEQLSNLQTLLQREKLLFSREIEAYYSIEQNEIEAFIEQQLPRDAYTVDSILGEKYIQVK